MKLPLPTRRVPGGQGRLSELNSAQKLAKCRCRRRSNQRPHAIFLMFLYSKLYSETVVFEAIQLTQLFPAGCRAIQLYSGCILYSYTCYTLYSAIQSPSALHAKKTEK